ncbi:Circadian phase modifier [Serinicoccus hydrothermalis]|uniref:Circadian phase modifier n=1 Tax=Serinicoccus hydrothermalis TaxID=1758689 RepID=A0A1B1NGR1_9MICO|nr:nickel pincer cofactor biosynthesis protein LarB [Serinicoccus hydrothermalis]ANS80600.1 Circadian phase modifier [Serinicoccus hydrothermalis]
MSTDPADGTAPEDIRLDLQRSTRRGYPEAVLCDAKTPDQVARVARTWRESGDPGPVLFTRIGEGVAALVQHELPDAHHDPLARVVAWPAEPPAPQGGRVLVLAAGTSDLPVAQEALVTARHLGRDTRLVVDVGVAGLHRLLDRLEELRDPAVRAIVVAAGMDGALPSVVAGLVGVPVVAVPTSVGYGASFGGVAALLTMLNSCAPGVAVVNIDNGYGAGHLAAQISAPGSQPAS